MLSIMFKANLLLLSCCLLGIHESILARASHYESQLLDCAPAKSIKIGQPNLPCKKIAQDSPQLGVANSSHNLGTTTEANQSTNIFRINFNNILKRQAPTSSKDDCTSEQRVSEGVICTPDNHSVVQETTKKLIDVYVLPTNNEGGPNSLDARADQNVYMIGIGTTETIQCRFNVSNYSDLSFKLRWLRLVAGSQGPLNQSIISDDSPITISANRVGTIQRDGGLDLLMNDFRHNDTGDYFCQAISADSQILDEQRIRIESREKNQTELPEDDELSSEIDASSLYSQENLEKLLPSLHIIPDYKELAYGDSIQLACVTSELDPDPDAEKIEWRFEPFKRPGYASESQDEDSSALQLPANATQLGNILMIWFMSKDTSGIYKCAVHLIDFNLTAEASAELVMRPNVDSAPLVYITPELMRMSADGSAKIQCESTGYPAPLIEWYRVEVPNVTQTKPSSDNALTQNNTLQRSTIEQMNGLQLLMTEPQDSMAYCTRFGCRALGNLDPQGRLLESRKDSIDFHKTLVTGLSWIQINQARAHHQGQYVCKATNKHGSNQASSIVDIEFKEIPVVEIFEGHRHQTIVLDEYSDPSSGQIQRLQNVSFRCSIKSGQPKPRLKWLRISDSSDISTRMGNQPYEAANLLNGHDLSLFNSSNSHNSLDIYDLTRVSSATSKVTTQYEDDTRTLILHLSTVSIDDEGNYICLGENDIGRHSAVARLVVRRPPQVRILQSSPKVFRPNESFQLDCLVTGHPAPIDIEWSRSDRGAFFSLISSRHSPSLAAHQEKAVLKFDRTTSDEAGEYTCAARDPLNSFNILRDTIMLLADEDQQSTDTSFIDDASRSSSSTRRVPKLLVRPTKITAEIGSNITLDCLAISGLQPTVVEWLAPASALISQTTSPNSHVRPYYRSPLIEFTHGTQSLQDNLLQFGSKLRLFNVSQAHAGVYQCKGRNKAGIESAPALVNIVDRASVLSNVDGSLNLDDNPAGSARANRTETKTKIARMGTNIELRCQVNGIGQQLATSWSREGRQLPLSSVQIDHNLWIQNLTKADEGLYLCSVRSMEPNEIIQAQIKLLVHEIGKDDVKSGRYSPSDLNAKIVASKNHLNVGDSVTLECIINFVGNASNSLKYPSRVLDNLERQVIWTNLHSGQSLFQDNVYIQNNLLIIYDLKYENTATYRCSYNDLTQHVDYKLQISLADDQAAASATSNASISDRDSFGSIISNHHHPSSTSNISHDDAQIKHIKLSVGAKLILECPKHSNDTSERYFWTRGRGFLHSDDGSVSTRWRLGREMEPLVLNPVETSHAGLYQCSRQLVGATINTHYRIEMHFLVEVQVVSAKFVQRPVSFVTLPAVSDADHQLVIELKFFPENEHGLMLFSGAALANTLLSSQANSSSSTQQNNKSPVTLTSADYISLGLVRGHLEFRFELGDGVTILRSPQPLKLNKWHRLLIERNRRGATMWLDGLAPQSNSSVGKFFNLNLDSLLYVGGHQIFLTLANAADNQRRRSGLGHVDGRQVRAFYGFARGYQGCISYLRINGRELNLMARNRSVSMGIFECDKLECPGKYQISDSPLDCSGQNGVCQVDRYPVGRQQQALMTNATIKRQQTLPDADLRCICLPGFTGRLCNETLPPYHTENLASVTSLSPPQEIAATTTSTARPVIKSQSACDQYPDAKCNSTGTGQCQSLSSTTFRCHCKSGFMGELCDQMVAYASETSIGFNQPAYIQLSFNAPKDITRSLAAGQQRNSSTDGLLPSILNETEYARLTTFTENQNITFKIQTRSSYGLLFYIGQISSFPVGDDESYKVDLNNSYIQTSKSIVANLLARLSTTKVGDFLAIALVDGHLELSYELGSGLAICRSSKRINDGDWHSIEVSRTGKASKLIIDEMNKHDAHSPGKLSMLNVGPDIYLGGLPTKLQAAIASSSSSGSLLSTFVGCLSSLQINSLGPINLIRGDHLTQVKSARNLVPCNNGLSSTKTTSQLLSPSDKISIDQVAIKPTEPTTTPIRRTTKKPAKPSHNAESDDDDSDELARSS